MTATSIQLTWTATGDNGSIGTAAQYDIRYSTAAITAANFGSATAATGTPTPTAAGTLQQVTISGLTAGTLYHFAMKPADEVPNWSLISNLPTASTLPTADVVAPNAVGNLSTDMVTPTSLQLNWTAPGDNGSIGMAAQYDIRFSTTAITAANFNAATALTFVPTPTAPGTTQHFTVNGLTANTTYHFAMKTADEVPNWSTLSNVPNVSTLSADITAPNPVGNLSTSTVTPTSVQLNWTAPGDNGSIGMAAQYDIRFSTTPITATNFDVATALTFVPAPTAPGTTQHFTVNGLIASTMYHFAMKTADEIPNWSTLSNLPSVSTLPPADITAPNPVDNLSTGTVTPTSLQLTWTSPGDNGSIGTAARYDIRFSTTAITSANFGSAAVVTGAPTPTAAGTSQHITLSGLTANTTFHFAMKTADEVPNWSTLSNVPSVSTLPTPDVTAPGAVGNLTTDTVTLTSLRLSWTAPGDNGSIGTAAQYDIRFSTTAITSANFGSATAVTGAPTPAAAGTTQLVTVSGLTAGTTYHFAMKTADEVPNWSTLSNLPNVSTLPVPDVTPPDAVGNLSTDTVTLTSLRLSWTAPGDNGSIGTAVRYDIRYSTTEITSANFGSATAVIGAPTPIAAGSTQRVTVSGLTAGTIYHFAMKAADEVPNWSTLSNVPSVSTLPVPDVTAPDAVGDLTTDTVTPTSLRLIWAAPGDNGSIGTAARYDIRISPVAITTANFGSATVLTGAPTPTEAGSFQHLEVSGLNPDTIYHFALKTADEVPNWSILSNVPNVSTLPEPDVTAPDAIGDLSTDTVTMTSLRLTWTAPGNDGSIGTAAQYDIRFSTTAFTSANFDTATALTGDPTPTAAGTSQHFTVNGLTPGTTYHFAMKTADAVPNWSTLSNLTTVTTQTLSDTTPPVAIGDLGATAIDLSRVVLTWSAPGDDGAVGSAHQYDIRYSTSMITEALWTSALQVAGEPNPTGAGSAQVMVVPGLQSNTQYFFAIKSTDEMSNRSAISNSASAQTP